MVPAPVLEVEAKVRVADVAGLRSRLKSAGARKTGVEEQQDSYYSHPSRDLAGSDEALRVRRAGKAIELTYKGPRLVGDTKARREETLHLQEDPHALLEALGFRVAARLRKRRESFILGRATVAIDRLSGLGDFVEVEVVATNAKAATKRVENILTELGLVREPRLRESYLELALASGAAAATRV